MSDNGTRVSIVTSPTNTRTVKRKSTCRSLRMQSSLEDFRRLGLWRSVFAEFVGMFLLVLSGVGSTVQSWREDHHLDVLQIALSFGLSVATSVWIIGHISGGHINPAVSIAMLVTRRISLVKAILFIIVQCLGSIAAAGVLKVLTPPEQRGSLGCTTLAKGMSPGMGIGVELLITCFLVLTVFASCDKNRTDLAGSFPLTIGLSVTMGHLWAVEFTGSSMNPARTLGPAVVMEIWDDHWVYWVGPLAGGIIAGLLYDNILASNASLAKARDCLLASDFDDENYQIVTARNQQQISYDEDEQIPMTSRDS